MSATLPTSTPEAQGIPSGAILAFVDAVDREVQHLHSLVLLRRGAVIAEGYWDPYGADQPHMQFSLSKSFTSAAIGLLVEEGRLSLDDRMVDLFPRLVPADPSEHLRAMRVRHLLTMTAGHATNPLRAMRQAGRGWTGSFMAQPVDHAPGTHFAYSDAASYVLSAIVQRLTGQRLAAYMWPRLLQPLGIEQLTWGTSPEGIELGGWEMSATTREVARFGQLCLQRGRWGDRQLVPSTWVDAATAWQVPSQGIPGPEHIEGYGYQFWRCRHGAYRADGAFGQLCVVMPKQEAVLTTNGGAGLGVYPRVIELAWEHLLPAMAPGPLPHDPVAAAALADRLRRLRLPTVIGARASPLAAALTGRTFAIAPNPDGIEAIGFDFRDDGCTFTIQHGGGEQRVPCGFARWARGPESALPVPTMFRAEPVRPTPPVAPVTASGAWADGHTYVVRFWWCGTAFGRTLTSRFAGARVTIEQTQNVSFGPTTRATLEGRLVTPA